MGWRTVFKIAEKEEQGKQLVATVSQFSLLSHVPQNTQAENEKIDDSKHNFQEPEVTLRELSVSEETIPKTCQSVNGGKHL